MTKTLSRNEAVETCKPVDKGMVLHGYAKLEPTPVSKHTCDQIIMCYLYLCHTLIAQARQEIKRQPLIGSSLCLLEYLPNDI
jgi:hypothetical protein